MLVGTNDGSVVVLSAAGAETRRIRTGERQRVTALCWLAGDDDDSGKPLLLVGDAGGRLSIFSVCDGRRAGQWPPCSSAVVGITVGREACAGGRRLIVLADHDGTIHIGLVRGRLWQTRVADRPSAGLTPAGHGRVHAVLAARLSDAHGAPTETVLVLDATPALVFVVVDTPVLALPLPEQCTDMCLLDDGSVCLAGRDGRLYRVHNYALHQMADVRFESALTRVACVRGVIFLAGHFAGLRCVHADGRVAAIDAGDFVRDFLVAPRIPAGSGPGAFHVSMLLVSGKRTTVTWEE